MHLLAHMLVACVLLIAAVVDLRVFLIPNRVCLTILALLPLAWILHGPVPPLASSVQAFLLTFMVLGIIWHIGHTVRWMSFGGGDWKLLSALAPWVGLQGLPGLLVVTALFGGIESVIILVFRAIVPSKSSLRTNSWTGPVLVSSGVPYGVSIALGGILAIVELSLS